MEDISLHKLYGVTKIIPELARAAWRLVEGHGSLGKVTEPCGAWWRIKEACRKSYDMSGRNLGRK
jgi:hypothetical protein